MYIKFSFNKNLEYVPNINSNITLSDKEIKRFKEHIKLTKKKYYHLKGLLYNKFKNEFKGSFEKMADYINNTYNSGTTELIETINGNILSFYLIDNIIAVKGIITPYGIMLNHNVLFHITEYIYIINIKENTLQIEL